MGRYQYALFVLCGFGWFADKSVIQSYFMDFTAY